MAVQIELVGCCFFEVSGFRTATHIDFKNRLLLGLNFLTLYVKLFLNFRRPLSLRSVAGAFGGAGVSVGSPQPSQAIPGLTC